MKHYYFASAGMLLLIIFSFSVKSQSITFSELNYNSDSTTNSGNWVELYNFGTTSLDISNWYLKDNDNANNFTFPAGTVLQANARLVVTNSVADFTSLFPLVANYIGEMTFSFGNDSDQVRLFDNTGNLKVFMHYTDSLPWPAEAADGTGRTLELVDPNVSPDDPANWFVGCMGGSPGKAFSPCVDNIVFSEINYNSDTLLDAGDWIELHNISNSGVNLTGWSLKDSHDANIYFFPSGKQLAPGEYLVIVHDSIRFKARHPTVTNYLGQFEFNLSNDGELVRLFSYTGKITFSIVYDDDIDWPESPDGQGYTLELLSATGNMNIPGDWFAGCLEGSPGYAYDPDCNTGVAAVYGSSLDVTTDLTNHELTVILNGNENITSPITASIYNSIGQRVFDKKFSGSEMHIATRLFPVGIYILSLHNEKLRWSEKFLVH